MPLALSDEQLDTIFDLCRPLEPLMRDPYLRAMAAEIEKLDPERVGPGSIFRIGKALQREFLRTPSLATVPRSRPPIPRTTAKKVLTFSWK